MAIWDDVIPRAEQQIYEDGGWGGRVGFGQRAALLVVDMYTAFVDPAVNFALQFQVQSDGLPEPHEEAENDAPLVTTEDGSNVVTVDFGKKK